MVHINSTNKIIQVQCLELNPINRTIQAHTNELIKTTRASTVSIEMIVIAIETVVRITIEATAVTIPIIESVAFQIQETRTQTLTANRIHTQKT